jgi:hypothetical protein
MFFRRNWTKIAENGDHSIDPVSDDLVGKEVNFVFKIVNCRGLPNKYRVIHFPLLRIRG